ncbi:MAG: GTPase HflX [Planctomycetes bacterium]|nr:GTPase HflX [Planctomycetota bacterium]
MEERISTSRGVDSHAKERALLVGVILSSEKDSVDTADPLAEIGSLVEAAGGEPIGGLVQRREKPDSRTYIGKGKVAEAKELAAALDADLVVFDCDLSPGQVRNLESDLERRVVDRSELILDIFARRARTRQAKAQVELAQLQYTMPRLRRMWTHLERTEGAIGARGPGETQLETDRRLIQKKIRDLRAELQVIEERRQREGEARRGHFRICLVGYTNAGKSTLLNRLTGAEEYVADQLFATLDTRTRQWRLGDGRVVLLSDTVGFVRELPHHLVASFHATLEEARSADLLLEVIDAGSPEALRQADAVEQVLGELELGSIPRLVVLNQIDRVTDRLELAVLRNRFARTVAVSARTGEGLQELEAEVGAIVDRDAEECVLRVHAGDGRALSVLREVGVKLGEEYLGEHFHVRVRLATRELERLRSELRGGRLEVLPVESEHPPR